MPNCKPNLKISTTSKLYDLAIKIARESALEDLYEKTKLPISWLRKFRQGAIKSPSVHRVERIISAYGVRAVVIESKSTLAEKHD